MCTFTDVVLVGREECYTVIIVTLKQTELCFLKGIRQLVAGQSF